MADSSTRSVDRALALLQAVCTEGKLTLSDAARIVDLSPSTALRLLRSLASSGFVSKDTEGEYRPGAGIIQLGALALGHESLVSLCSPIMRELVKHTGESCYLSIRGVGNTALYIAIVEGTHSVRHASWVGRSIPLEGSAAGAVLNGTALEYGFSIVQSGVENDITAISVPVSMGGRTVAALSIVVPSYRVTDLEAHNIGRALVASAAGILTNSINDTTALYESMDQK